MSYNKNLVNLDFIISSISVSRSSMIYIILLLLCHNILSLMINEILFQILNTRNKSIKLYYIKNQFPSFEVTYDIYLFIYV